MQSEPGTGSVPSFSDIARYRADAPALKTIAVTHDLIGRYGRLAVVLERHLELLGRAKPFKVLDIGAHDRAFGRSLARAGLPCTYYSLDVDHSMPHDFDDIENVEGSFDVISMFELIEHLPYEQATDLLHKAYRLLAPAGRLFISTPNPFHPTQYFSDVSHKQHWPPDDLYAILRRVGFSRDGIEIYGVIYRSSDRWRRVLGGMRNLSWRALGIDRRGGILAIAVKG